MREPRVLAKRFRVKAALAHGGAGELLRVADLWRQGAERALRLQGIPPTEQQTRALEREYRFLSEIDHPLLPRAYDFGRLPDAYETLLLDIMTGDQTLFVHADEVEASWKLFESALDEARPVSGYAAGTWGPDAAAELLFHDGRTWSVRQGG